MKKGFTLVELIGVIIILGVLALITFPIIDKSIKNSKQQALEQIINNIEDAAYKYSVEHDIGYETYYKSLLLDTLTSAGILKDNIINPVTNEEMQGCVLYKWVEEYKQYEFIYDEECDVPPAPPNFIDILLQQYSEGAITGLVKDSTNPNLYYYTGTNDQVANNFLWYGGHQWRVLEFDESANTLTLITQQPLTAIQPARTVWTSSSSYESSYVNQWLTDYFWNSLDSSIQSNILDNTFNIGIYSDVDEITTIKNVGLLDNDQYIRAGNENSFLDIGDSLLLGNRYNSSNVRVINYDYGKLFYSSVLYDINIRPVIKISNLTIIEGDGTIENSYCTENKSTNTNNVQVGEYINVPYSGSDNACGSDKMCTFRVVSKDNDSIKVVLNGLLLTESQYGSSAKISTSHTIYTSLNTFAERISDTFRYTGNKTFYIGDYPGGTGTNYKEIQNEVLEASIGLPTVGEMFSGNDIGWSFESYKIFVDTNTIENLNSSFSYWTMNRYDSYDVISISNSGSPIPSLSSEGGVRPVIFLKNNLTFTGGNGTAQSPYQLS